MTCVWCGWDPPERLRTIEHLLPRSRGGTSGDENLAMACRGCNSRRKSQGAFAFVRGRARRVGIAPDTDVLLAALERLTTSGVTAERAYGEQQSALLRDWREQVERWGSVAI